jgi:hypothetical protein
MPERHAHHECESREATGAVDVIGEIVAVALGLLVGLSLGALGGGGSALAVPVLVFAAGLQATDATTASLLVVGVAAAVGAVSHFRNGNVLLGPGVAFGATGIAGSRVGLLVNHSLDEDLLLLSFSALILFVALRMFFGVDNEARRAEVSLAQPTDVDEEEAMRPGSIDRDGPNDGTTATMTQVGSRQKQRLSTSDLFKLAGVATSVGFLTGLFGVGGGFAVVPALTLLLKYPAKKAVGTSLVVIVINAAIALGMRAGDIGFDWSVVGPFLATVTIGVVVGTRVARNIEPARLTRAFALMLVGVAIYTAASSLLSI